MSKKEKQEVKQEKAIDETIMYKPIKTKKKKEPKKKKKHPKLRMFFKVIFVMCLILFVAVSRNNGSNNISLHMGRLGNW